MRKLLCASAGHSLSPHQRRGDGQWAGRSSCSQQCCTSSAQGQQSSWSAWRASPACEDITKEAIEALLTRHGLQSTGMLRGTTAASCQTTAQLKHSCTHSAFRTSQRASAGAHSLQGVPDYCRPSPGMRTAQRRQNTRAHSNTSAVLVQRGFIPPGAGWLPLALPLAQASAHSCRSPGGAQP